MTTVGTTCLSAKGQVVIPEDIRNRLGLQKGDQFIVVGERDVIMLKTIMAPSMRDFDDLVGRAREQARRAGIRKTDIKSVIAMARRRR